MSGRAFEKDVLQRTEILKSSGSGTFYLRKRSAYRAENPERHSKKQKIYKNQEASGNYARD